jgi:hypothetical protein
LSSRRSSVSPRLVPDRADKIHHLNPGTVYTVLLVFWVGIIFALLWIIGAVIAPTGRAEARVVA